VAAPLLILVLAACSSSASATPSPAASDGPASSKPTSAEVIVGTDDGANLKFEPATVSVPAGVEVSLTFANRSTVPHNLSLDDPIGVATSQVVAPGASEDIDFTVAEPGDYTFVCTLHPGMDGVLTVTAP
jgi:plastocyanin